LHNCFFSRQHIIMTTRRRYSVSYIYN